MDLTPPPPPRGLFISSTLDGDFIERESEREAYLRGGGLIGRMYSVGMLSNGEVACRLIQLCLHLKGNTKVIKSSCPEIDMFL